MSWHKVKLGSLGRVVTGKTPSRSRPDYFASDHPFVTPSDFGFRHYYCRDVAEGVSEIGFEKHKNQTIPQDAALCVCIGSTIGKCAIAPEPCLTNQQINSVIADGKTDPKFIYYLLCNMREQIRSVGLGGGAAQPIINKSKFSALEVRVPDLRTQQAIVESLSAYDDLIENNSQRIALLEEAARLLYREWFVRFRFPGHEHPQESPTASPNGGRGARSTMYARLSEAELQRPRSRSIGAMATSLGTRQRTSRRNSCLALLDSATKITEAGLRGSSAKMLPRGTVLMTSRASVRLLRHN